MGKCLSETESFATTCMYPYVLLHNLPRWASLKLEPSQETNFSSTFLPIGSLSLSQKQFTRSSSIYTAATSICTNCCCYALVVYFVVLMHLSHWSIVRVYGRSNHTYIYSYVHMKPDRYAYIACRKWVRIFLPLNTLDHIYRIAVDCSKIVAVAVAVVNSFEP